jgi:hypothetical protein
LLYKINVDFSNYYAIILFMRTLDGEIELGPIRVPKPAAILALSALVLTACGTHNPDNDVPWGQQPIESYIEGRVLPIGTNIRHTPHSSGIENLCEQTKREVTMPSSTGLFYEDTEGTAWEGFIVTNPGMPTEILYCGNDANEVVWIARNQ